MGTLHGWLKNDVVRIIQSMGSTKCSQGKCKRNNDSFFAVTDEDKKTSFKTFSLETFENIICISPLGRKECFV